MILSCGSAPIIPKFCANIQSFKDLFLCKNHSTASLIQKYVAENKDTGKKVAVIGGGYIGIELAESLLHHKFKVIVVEMEDRIMKRYFDKDFTDVAQQKLVEHGAELVL